MTTPTAPLPGTDRPAFIPGQLLTADELTAQQEADSGLRRLHHQVLHGWGIAQGLTVTGAPGDTTVDLLAGYALDITGRELVVPETLTVPVPPVAAGPGGGPVPYALVLRWTEDDEATVLHRPGPCGAQGAVRRSDLPTVAWRDPAAVRSGHELVLAEIQLLGCRLTTAPDPAARRTLNPPPTPYGSAGRTRPGWTVWRVRAAPRGEPWAVSTDVDTAEAGFGDVPVYLARVAGERLLPAASSPTGVDALIDGTPFVEAPETGRFRLVVPLVPGIAGGPRVPLAVNPPEAITATGFEDLVSSVLRWHVEWIGLQT
ncbi:hypothetical protein ACFYOV_28735 [Streptomyces sp. NPDC005931]|uniref:hypothetical protein n=1 Tax=Streptomyces sp. NPDC005931 TaxID=3364737 RepID=UPI00368EF66C